MLTSSRCGCKLYTYKKRETNYWKNTKKFEKEEKTQGRKMQLFIGHLIGNNFYLLTHLTSFTPKKHISYVLTSDHQSLQFILGQTWVHNHVIYLVYVSMLKYQKNIWDIQILAYTHIASTSKAVATLPQLEYSHYSHKPSIQL